ncbi:MAG: acyltransferase [Prevotella sp.]|nr:acyltransferase [Prevotella sp.]
MKRFLEIDLAKGLAIILAVVGHAFPDAVKGFWIAGGNSVAASMESFIYSFHMPLFFMCSGFLFLPKLTNGGVSQTIATRFKRLMIPYLFLSFMYLGGKMVGGALADNALSDNPIVGIIFGNSPCFGAWFLWVLFIMSVIVLCLKKVNVGLLFAAFIAASYIPLHLDSNFKGISAILSATMWFLMGCVVRKHYDCISKYLNIYVCMMSFLVILSIHLYGGMIDSSNGLITRTIAIIKTFTGITASYTLCYILASKFKESTVTKKLQMCGDYCMDIYIVSMFVLVPLRILYVNVGLMNYIPYWPWVIIASALGIVLPILISKHIVRKVGILRVLLIGG